MHGVKKLTNSKKPISSKTSLPGRDQWGEGRARRAVMACKGSLV
jgi:hypothetical protein